MEYELINFISFHYRVRPCRCIMGRHHFGSESRRERYVCQAHTRTSKTMGLCLQKKHWWNFEQPARTICQPLERTGPQHVITDAQSHSCDYCRNSFSQSLSLLSHKRIHAGEKLFICGDCIGNHSACDKHASVSTIHTKEKPSIPMWGMCKIIHYLFT